MAGTHETIPSWVLERADLSPAAKLVYGYLRPLAAKRWPAAQRLIGSRLGMSKSMVLRAVRDLLEKNLLEVEKSSRRGTTYRLGAVRGRTGSDEPSGPRTDRNEEAQRSADGPEQDEVSGPSADPVGFTDGPLDRSADGPLAVHGRTASGPSTDQFQTTKPPNPPSQSPAPRPIVNFGAVPDPLDKSQQVSVEHYVLRIWQKACKGRGAPVSSPKPSERQALDEIAEWGRAAAPQVAAERGVSLESGFRHAITHSLKAFGGEFDEQRRKHEAGYGRVPAWKATWWRSNLDAYAMGLLAPTPPNAAE